MGGLGDQAAAGDSDAAVVGGGGDVGGIRRDGHRAVGGEVADGLAAAADGQCIGAGGGGDGGIGLGGFEAKVAGDGGGQCG